MVVGPLWHFGLQPHHALGHSGRHAYGAWLPNHLIQFLREHPGDETPMSADSSSTPPEFDQYAGEYDRALAEGLSVSGEDKSYFARGRVIWLANCLRQLGHEARTVLDFGCGTGSAA